MSVTAAAPAPPSAATERPARWDALAALEFLTILRLRRYRPLAPMTVARAQAFYPLVGVLLGALLLAADWLLALALPAGPRAAVLLVLLALLTRGLHLDGLADTFDGLLGGHDREQRLAIMRDPRVGSFGAAALALTLLVQWTALAALPDAGRSAALLLAPCAGRLAIVVLAAAVPYAREHGLGRDFHTAARGWPLALAAGTALVAALLFGGGGGLALLASALVVPLLLGWWAWRALGGATGDLYGATCELAQAAALLVTVAW